MATIMKLEQSTSPSVYIYFVCAGVGAFVAFMLPTTDIIPNGHTIFAKVVAFELKYNNVVLALGGLWLLYLLLKKKVFGGQAMIVCGGVGFICARLLLAFVSAFR